MLLINKFCIATVQIYYYRPDYKNIIQEFVWQTEDIKPKFPRINQFLLYWKENITAPIESIELSHRDIDGLTEYVNCKSFFNLH